MSRAAVIADAMPFAGLVLAAEDGAPLEGATITVSRGGELFGTTTNAQGVYYFDQAAPGEMVTLRYVGRQTETFEVPRETGQVYRHVLEPSAGVHEFEVFGDAPDEPAAAGNSGVLALLGVALLLLLFGSHDRNG